MWHQFRFSMVLMQNFPLLFAALLVAVPAMETRANTERNRLQKGDQLTIVPSAEVGTFTGGGRLLFKKKKNGLLLSYRQGGGGIMALGIPSPKVTSQVFTTTYYYAIPDGTAENYGLVGAGLLKQEVILARVCKIQSSETCTRIGAKGLYVGPEVGIGRVSKGKLWLGFEGSLLLAFVPIKEELSDAEDATSKEKERIFNQHTMLQLKVYLDWPF